MSTPRNVADLTRKLESFRLNTVERRVPDPSVISPFFTRTADFMTPRGIVRGANEIASTSRDFLSLRATSDVVTMKWPAKDIALVDSVFDSSDGKGWITELWRQSDDRGFAIDVSRIRVGSPETAYAALSQQAPTVIPSDLENFDQGKEEETLRGRFKEFRAAFNSGDSEALMGLFTEDTDASPVFSFLNGRSQVLNGRMAIGEKAERMAGALVSNPAMGSRQNALFVDGEPKVVRFLSSTVAVVDGTAAIAGIPRAHGFSPSEMKGVYTDVWRKTDGQWLIQGSRPWF